MVFHLRVSKVIKWDSVLYDVDDSVLLFGCWCWMLNDESIFSKAVSKKVKEHLSFYVLSLLLWFFLFYWYHGKTFWEIKKNMALVKFGPVVTKLRWHHQIAWFERPDKKISEIGWNDAKETVVMLKKKKKQNRNPEPENSVSTQLPYLQPFV